MMGVYVHEDDVLTIQENGLPGGLLIGEANGATKGFCIGIAHYNNDEYLEPGVHDDQEGFCVLEGTGMAKVGDEEFEVRPGTSFIAQAGVPHVIKKDPRSGPVKILYAHGAV